MPKYLKTGGHRSRAFGISRNVAESALAFFLWWIMPSVILLATATLIGL